MISMQDLSASIYFRDAARLNVAALGRQKSDFSTPRLFFEEKLPKVAFSAD